MDKHICGLLQRAIEQGVYMYGITPTRIAGHGVGVVANRNLEKGDVVMTIPLEAIRSLHTIPKRLSSNLLPSMSIHGLLATDLTLHYSELADWMKVVPTWADFESTIPYLWPHELQQLLPAEAVNILAIQQSNFERDWSLFRLYSANESRTDYLYYWLLVSTRAFYYETTAMLQYPWNDRLAMLPVADLFNHADMGCSVSFSTEGYTITADRSYRAGDELYTSYGEHSNDFLLVEYGFQLKDNHWDKLCLDEVVLSRLDEEHRRELKDNGYLGSFVLHMGSKKTDNIWLALRLLCCEDTHWQDYIDGKEDVEGTLSKAIAMLPALLEEYMETVEKSQEKIRQLQTEQKRPQKLLLERWEQIEGLVKWAMAETWFPEPLAH